LDAPYTVWIGAVLEGGHRGHVEHRATAGGDEIGQHGGGERHDALTVEAHQGRLGLRVIDHVPNAAGARVVHQERRASKRACTIANGGCCGGGGDVDRQRVDGRVAVGAGAGGELVEALGATGHGEHGASARGELSRQLEADSGRRAGDDRETFGQCHARTLQRRARDEAGRLRRSRARSEC
jgi:hypothetical protein